MPACRILLVEDHRLLADSLAALLRRWNALAEIHAVHTAENIPAAQSMQHDLAVLDWHVPGIDTAALAIDLAERDPPTPTLVVTGSQDVADLSAALDAGCAGFLHKTDTADTLFAALNALVTGGTWISAHQTRQAAAFRRGRAGPKLSERQQAVLDLLSKGHSNVQIGQSLRIRTSTVKTHVAAVLAAVGAANRAEAVYRGRALGLIRSED